MPKLYYCEYKVNRQPASRYVIARNVLHAVDLVLAHYALLSPMLKVSEFSAKSLDFISSLTVKRLNEELNGNN